MDMKWLFPAGILIAIYLGTSYWVFADVLRLPRTLRLSADEVRRDLQGAGAFGWLLNCLTLWFVAFPTYLVRRGALIRAHRPAWERFNKRVTESGLPAHLRTQALVNGLYLALVAVLPVLLVPQAGTWTPVFLWSASAWSGWALVACGVLVLAALAVEAGLTGPARMRVARAMMPGLPLLGFAAVTAILGIADLQHVLAVAGPGRTPGVYAWTLAFWMVPAVAAVNMATEAFVPGLTTVFTAVRALWPGQPRRRARAR